PHRPFWTHGYRLIRVGATDRVREVFPFALQHGDVLSDKHGHDSARMTVPISDAIPTRVWASTLPGVLPWAEVLDPAGGRVIESQRASGCTGRDAVHRAAYRRRPGCARRRGTGSAPGRDRAGGPGAVPAPPRRPV